MTDNEISCLAPKQTNTGNFTVIYEADGSKVIGPDVRCIADPVIEHIYPASSIVRYEITNSSILLLILSSIWLT